MSEGEVRFGELSTAAEVRAASVALAAGARRSLHIHSRHLDPDIYDNQPFLDALTRLVTSHPSAFVRILVRDAGPAINDGNRLIQLAQRLSSSIEIREPGLQHRGYNAAFLVADARGVIYRELSDRYESQADEDNRARARQLIHYHDQAWAFSVSNPSLRALHI